MASNRPDPALIQAIVDSSKGDIVTLGDLINAKARREAELRVKYPSQFMTRVSRGELVLATTVMQGDTYGIPVEWFKQWFGEERLPDGYITKRKMTLSHMLKETETVISGVDKQFAALEKERKNT